MPNKPMEISNDISNASVPSFHDIFNYWGCLDCLFSGLVLLPTETTSPLGLFIVGYYREA
jgi:hypothetical protein